MGDVIDDQTEMVSAVGSRWCAQCDRDCLADWVSAERQMTIDEQDEGDFWLPCRSGPNCLGAQIENWWMQNTAWADLLRSERAPTPPKGADQ